MKTAWFQDESKGQQTLLFTTVARGHLFSLTFTSYQLQIDAILLFFNIEKFPSSSSSSSVSSCKKWGIILSFKVRSLQLGYPVPVHDSQAHPKPPQLGSFCRPAEWQLCSLDKTLMGPLIYMKSCYICVGIKTSIIQAFRSKFKHFHIFVNRWKYVGPRHCACCTHWPQPPQSSGVALWEELEFLPS